MKISLQGQAEAPLYTIARKRIGLLIVLTQLLRKNLQACNLFNQLHPLAHVQFASLNSVQRLSPKKGASDKNSQTG